MDTESNGTTQTNSTSFVWTYDETTKVFPIDYSVHELHEKENWPYQAIRTHLLQNPLLYGSTNQSNSTNSSQTQIPHKASFPVEALPFFKSFFMLRNNPSYKTLFRKSNNKQRAKVDMQLFVEDLCRNLYNEVCQPSPNSEDPNAYCRQALFNNKTFVSVVLSDLWESEIEKRVNTLKTLLFGAEPKLQLEVLRECLLSLDQCIARFSTSSAEKKEKKPIQAMLNQILFARSKMRQRSKSSTSYRIPNSTFMSPATETKPSEKKQMQTAFTEINNHFNPVGPQYMEAARNSYLQQLATLHPSSTEQQFKAVTDYLSQIAAPVEQLRSKLLEWTNEWCNHVISSCITAETVWDIPSFNLSHYGYGGELVTKLAHMTMTRLLKHFDDTVNLIRVYRFLAIYTGLNSYTDDMRMLALSQQITEIGVDDEATDKLLSIVSQTFAYQIFPSNQKHNTNFCYDHAVELVSFLKGVCSASLKQDSVYFNDDGTIKTRDFSNWFSSATTSAAEAFLPGSGSLYTATNIEKYLDPLNTIVSHPEKYIRFEIFLNASIPLLDGVLFQLLHRIQSDCIETTVNAASFLSEKNCAQSK